jgi:hypothetical protein
MTVWTLAFPARVYSGGLPSESVMVNVLIESGSPGEAARDLGDVLRALVRQAQVPSSFQWQGSPKNALSHAPAPSRTETETSHEWPLHRLGLVPEKKP